MVTCGSAGERCNSRSNGSASTRRCTHRSPSAGPTSTRGGAAAAVPDAAPYAARCPRRHSRANIEARRDHGGSSRCGALLCPLPASAALTPPLCGPQVIMPRMATFGQPATSPLFFGGSLQLLPVRDRPADASSRCHYALDIYLPRRDAEAARARRCRARHGAGHGGWLASGPQATACRNSAEKNEDSAYTAKEALYL